MQCNTPFQLKQRDILTGEWVLVPCGRCPTCVKKRASAWSFRLMQEEKRSKTATFVTMSYQDKNLPMSEYGLMTLKKDQLQGFIKRLRYYSGSSSIKYYAVGEYGTKRLRPHYHLIMFNAQISDMEKAWGLGRIHYGSVTGASIGYTLKYISKTGSKVGLEESDDRQPEFGLMSKGLGLNYMTEAMVKWHLKDIDNRMYVNVAGGMKVSMPRYYKDKLFSEQNFENIEQANEVRKKAGHFSRIRMVQEYHKLMEIQGDMYEHNMLQADLEAWYQLHQSVEENLKL